MEKRFDDKLDSLDKKIDFKHDLSTADIRNLTTMMAAAHASVMHVLDLDRAPGAA